MLNATRAIPTKRQNTTEIAGPVENRTHSSFTTKNKPKPIRSFTPTTDYLPPYTTRVSASASATSAPQDSNRRWGLLPLVCRKASHPRDPTTNQSRVIPTRHCRQTPFTTSLCTGRKKITADVQLEEIIHKLVVAKKVQVLISCSAPWDTMLALSKQTPS